MKSYSAAEFTSPSEKLNVLVNLVELALYAPSEEMTLAGHAALQQTARQIVVLSHEITGAGASSARS